MSDATTGVGVVLAITAAAALLYAAALRLRSWPLWLCAFAMTLAALGASWRLRDTVPRPPAMTSLVSS